MAWYRANARFGGWRPGDEFESHDERHAELAANTRLLTELPPWPPEPAAGEGPPPSAVPQRSEEPEAAGESEVTSQDPEGEESPGQPTLWDG